jgi:hypothetical protein
MNGTIVRRSMMFKGWQKNSHLFGTTMKRSKYSRAKKSIQLTKIILILNGNNQLIVSPIQSKSYASMNFFAYNISSICIPMTGVIRSASNWNSGIDERMRQIRERRTKMADPNESILAPNEDRGFSRNVQIMRRDLPNLTF